MQIFERDYARLMRIILDRGDVRQTRNGETKSMFALNLTVEIGDTFPLLFGRKMFTKGVLGEYAAMIRQPKCLADFEKWGCNYWAKWAKPDGSINVDYGNAWFAGGQMDHLFDCLANNPNDRRMLISGWVPENLADLDLPCCHYSYQFYVEDDKLHMIWNQRSVDMMIGLPSDIIFAAIWLITLANQFGYKPGFVKFNLGDCHIYREHYAQCEEYLQNLHGRCTTKGPTYQLLTPPGYNSLGFEPNDIIISNYSHLPAMKLELKA